MVQSRRDDVWMVDVDVSGGLGAVPRRRRSAMERRRVVEETLDAELRTHVAKVSVFFPVASISSSRLGEGALKR
jgi:hypothetical protein